MKLIIAIDEKQFSDIKRVAEVQLELNHYITAEQIIANGIPYEESKDGDLISRSALKEAIAKSQPCCDVWIDLINNAPTVTPEGDLANEVLKLYEKHQSHLATHVIEFGDELKELLGKYQKGGTE